MRLEPIPWCAECEPNYSFVYLFFVSLASSWVAAARSSSTSFVCAENSTPWKTTPCQHIQACRYLTEYMGGGNLRNSRSIPHLAVFDRWGAILKYRKYGLDGAAPLRRRAFKLILTRWVKTDYLASATTAVPFLPPTNFSTRTSPKCSSL